MKADVKAIVNDIVDELAKEERVAECYQAWLKSREEIQHYYKDSEIEMIPLSQQKELKSVKNMVIREAVRFGEGYLYLEEAETGIERLEEISEQQTESLAALQGRTCRISCLDKRRWRSRNQTGRKKSMGNPFLILPDGRTGIKKRGNISMARWGRTR